MSTLLPCNWAKAITHHLSLTIPKNYLSVHKFQEIPADTHFFNLDKTDLTDNPKYSRIFQIESLNGMLPSHTRTCSQKCRSSCLFLLFHLIDNGIDFFYISRLIVEINRKIFNCFFISLFMNIIYVNIRFTFFLGSIYLTG